MFPLKDNIPTERTPVITIALIAINCIVYLFLQPKTGIDFDGSHLNQCRLYSYGFVPYELTHHARNVLPADCPVQHQLSPWLTPFTAMFTHAGLLHLGGNMLFLWIFGNNVEDSMGPVRFIVFYVLGGLAATALQTAVGPNSLVPNLGASGAIAGVLGGYILLYPRARVVTVVFIILFFTILEIPAFLVLGLWFLQQALFGAADITNPTGGGGGVAYFAHIGGFAFGLLAIKAFAQRRNALADRPRFPVY